MPVPQGAMHGGGQPSCFDRVKMGFMMGMCVGMASGGILGGFGALRMGMRGRHDSMIMYRSSGRSALASSHTCPYIKLTSSATYAEQVRDFFTRFFSGSELIQGVGKVMVQGGGTFGTFMAIGTGIRC